MTVLDDIRRRRAGACLHATIIDPDKQAPAQAGRIAQIAAAAGSDLIMVGGSTGMTQDLHDQTLQHINAVCGLPTLLFPSGAHAVSTGADAILFMSLLNSRSPRFLIREQAKAAPAIRAAGIETIPTGYIIIEPGMTVGKVGEADLIRRDDPAEAVRYATAAELFGLPLIYLESGSGAPEPLSAAFIRAVRESVSLLICVGGGIRYPEQAASAAAAGADIVVTGTLVEQEADIAAALVPLIAALKTPSQEASRL
jgi:phosphoglycerol geranylgeranyltransferase